MINIDDIWNTEPHIIKQFQEQLPNYQQLCQEVSFIIKKRMKENNIAFSAITSRAKTLKSFLEKTMVRKQYKDSFQEVTDFAGVRLVYLYLDDVEKIKKIIKDEFIIDYERSVDKSLEKSTSEFGYNGLSFIIRLGDNCSGARYDDLKQLHCEIQVRTVAQNSWAIVDHHLLYKNESDIPDSIERDIYILSATFELIDKQFNSIKQEKEKYIAEIVKKKLLDTKLNIDSFKAFVDWKFPKAKANFIYINSLYKYIDKSKYSKLIEVEEILINSRKLRDKFYRSTKLERLPTDELWIAFLLEDRNFREQNLSNLPNSYLKDFILDNTKING